MDNQDKKKSISDIFNKFGKDMIHTASNPAFLGSMLAMGLVISTFDKQLANTMFSMPVFSFGVGIASKATGMCLKKINKSIAP